MSDALLFTLMIPVDSFSTLRTLEEGRCLCLGGPFPMAYILSVLCSR